jgi:sulfur carrier protein ThiS
VTASGAVTVSVHVLRGLPAIPAAGGGRAAALRPASAGTGGDLLDLIGIDTSADATVAVNGEIATPDTPLPDDADVMILSPMEGGAHEGGDLARR